MILVGGAVRLRAGGPVMTVFEIESDRRIWCNWLVGHVMHRAALPAVALVCVERAPAPRAAG